MLSGLHYCTWINRFGNGKAFKNHLATWINTHTQQDCPNKTLASPLRSIANACCPVTRLQHQPCSMLTSAPFNSKTRTPVAQTRVKSLLEVTTIHPGPRWSQRDLAVPRVAIAACQPTPASRNPTLRTCKGNEEKQAGCRNNALERNPENKRHTIEHQKHSHIVPVQT